MFAHIYNTDFILDNQGNVVKADGGKIFKLPPNMPPLRFISDKVHCLCLDIEDNLWSFDENKLTHLKSNVKQVIIEKDVYVLTNNNNLYYYENGEFIFIKDNISWISSYRYADDFVDELFDIMGCDNKIAMYFGATIYGESFSLQGCSYNAYNDKYLPTLNDIKFIRDNLILTHNNNIIYVDFGFSIMIYKINCEYDPIDLSFGELSNGDQLIILILTSDQKLVECTVLDNDKHNFKEIKCPILEDVGIKQFITFKGNDKYALQSYRGYIFRYNQVDNLRHIEIFPKDYIPPLSNLLVPIMTKSARFKGK